MGKGDVKFNGEDLEEVFQWALEIRLVLRSPEHALEKFTGTHVDRHIFLSHRPPEVLREKCVHRPVIQMNYRFA